MANIRIDSFSQPPATRISGLVLGSYAVALLTVDAGYAYWRKKHPQKNIYAAFQPIAVLGPADIMERPAVLHMVQNNLTIGSEYEVIIRNCGTGKSTIVKKIASRPDCSQDRSIENTV